MLEGIAPVPVKIADINLNPGNRDIDDNLVKNLVQNYGAVGPDVARHPLVCSIRRADQEPFLNGNHTVVKLLVSSFDGKAIEWVWVGYEIQIPQSCDGAITGFGDSQLVWVRL